jgi:hypothetical protein
VTDLHHRPYPFSQALFLRTLAVMAAAHESAHLAWPHPSRVAAAWRPRRDPPGQDRLGVPHPSRLDGDCEDATAAICAAALAAGLTCDIMIGLPGHLAARVGPQIGRAIGGSVTMAMPVVQLPRSAAYYERAALAAAKRDRHGS